jgi:tripeptide aminopeptidase
VTEPIAVNAERVLNTFLKLLAIDSPSGEEDAIIRHLNAQLTQLDLETHIDEAGNLIGRLRGAGEPLLFCAHVDHVPPCRGIQSIVEGDLIRSNGDTVLGGDDTSGVAIILELLYLLHTRRQQTGVEAPALEIIFTVQEETGLRGSKGLDMSALAARQGIVLDMGGPRDAIVVQGPSQNTIRALVHGRKAHAACAPEEGINAIRVASEAIAAMPLGQVDAETTANIGIIHGGLATNIVPDLVEIVGEARSQDDQKLQRQTEAMAQALHEAAGRHGAHVDIDVESKYRAYRVPDDAPIVARLKQAMRQFGLEPVCTPTAGGSDANIFNEHGIQVVNISTGMDHVHSTEECIHLSEMVACAQLLAHLLHI